MIVNDGVVPPAPRQVFRRTKRPANSPLESRRLARRVLPVKPVGPRVVDAARATVELVFQADPVARLVARVTRLGHRQVADRSAQGVVREHEVIPAKGLGDEGEGLPVSQRHVRPTEQVRAGQVLGIGRGGAVVRPLLAVPPDADQRRGGSVAKALGVARAQGQRFARTTVADPQFGASRRLGRNQIGRIARLEGHDTGERVTPVETAAGALQDLQRFKNRRVKTVAARPAVERDLLRLANAIDQRQDPVTALAADVVRAVTRALVGDKRIRPAERKRQDDERLKLEQIRRVEEAQLFDIRARERRNAPRHIEQATRGLGRNHGVVVEFVDVRLRGRPAIVGRYPRRSDHRPKTSPCPPPGGPHHCAKSPASATLRRKYRSAPPVTVRTASPSAT